MNVSLNRAIVAAVSIALVGAAAACSSDASESDTAELVVGSGPPSEQFLRPEDVMLFPGFEGAEAVDLGTAPSFENPDPAAPAAGR